MKSSLLTLGTLMTVLATSLVVHAQAPPPPPPPPDCSPKTFPIRPDRYPDDYIMRAPQTPPGETYSESCKDKIPEIDGLRYKSGQMRATCVVSPPSSSFWSNSSENCEIDNIVDTCQVSATPGISRDEMEAAYEDANRVDVGVREMKEIPPGSMAQRNIFKVSVSCDSFYESGAPARVKSEGAFSSSLPSCNNASKGLCFLDPYEVVKNTATPTGAQAIQFELFGAKKSVPKGMLYIWNKSNTDESVPNGGVNFNYHRKIGTWDLLYTTASLPTSNSLPGVAAEATGCDLRVSGATSPYENTSPPSVQVENDVLIFTVNMKGGTGAVTIPPKVTFSGGPNAITGVWTNPPVNSRATVTANVVTGVSKTKFACSLRIDTAGPKSLVKLRRFGDCGYFDALRSHYFMTPNGKPQNGGYGTSKLLSMPGIEAKFGRTAGEVPFAGVANVAASAGGEIIVNSAGKVVMPPMDKRRFSRAVIVAKRFQGGTQVQEPLFWAVMDPNGYSTTRLSQVDPNIRLNDDDTVVFQAYLAAVQPNSTLTRDLRGTADGFPFHMFAPSTDTGVPFDRVIPFANESCIPLFQASPPLREDMPNNPQLLNTTQCLYSRPFKVSDVVAGRVDLNIMHIVPLHAHHQFPTELLKASNQPTCVAKNPTNTDYCWDVKAANMGVAANADPFSSHDQCRTVTTTFTKAAANATVYECTGGGGNGGGQTCRPVTHTTPTIIRNDTVTYKASCPVLESKNECNANLAIRFSGFNQMMIAGLGCAAKYDRAGELVTATLLEATRTPRYNGIIPYTPTMGASVPKHYQDYPAAYGDKKGYACIPCRFAKEALAAGKDLAQDTAALPVDQDSSSARKPIFSFRKMKAPKECIRNINFEVRYFGSQECDGVSNPPGHFCSSSNLGGQSCPGRDGMGTGNVAGKFTIPVCPNSGFEFDNISVSWSPLLIDVSGNGIEVTRDPAYAVKFDIKGDGKKRVIDWPLNVREIAFLVLPNKNGKVESGKELFGEYGASNGFAALAKHDSNKDLKINRHDKIYSQLRLWFDRNRNGVFDEGESEGLKENGVETIYLEYRKITNRGTEGRTLSSVYYNDKWREYLNIGDYYFNEYGSSEKKK